MKAEELTLQHLMALPHRDDAGFLNEHGMIISSAVAWGTLSRDLIIALGADRAKRFLMRYGWHCGQHEAEMFRDLFPWDDDMDWIFAGQKMHRLSGRVRSVPVKSMIDKNAGIFYVEGIWHDSYEAKQFLANFPIHHEPVCHFLAGYGSGYNSAILGKDVLFKEVECVGKGDPVCRYIVKTAEEWGPEAAAMRKMYEPTDLANELDRAYQSIEHQRRMEKRVMQISQHLTRIMLQGHGFESLVRTLGKNLNCGVVIENQYFQMLAGYGEKPAVALRDLIEKKGEYAKDKAHEVKVKMLSERNTVEFATAEQGAPRQHRLVTPIVLRGQLFGYISLLKGDEGFADLDTVLLERASGACSIQVMNDQTALETEQRLKGQLLDELFTKPVQEPIDATRYSFMGYDINQAHYVMIIKPQLGSVDHEALGLAIQKIREHLRSLLAVAGFPLFASVRLDNLSVLLPEAFLKKKRSNAKAFGFEFHAEAERSAGGIPVVIGFSDLCQGVERIYRSYKEAAKSIEVAKMKRYRTPVVFASELGYLSIMLDARDPDELERFADSVLEEIAEYDRQYDAEFLKTIYFYLDQECNLYQTARILNVSISGMRYRLNRLKEKFQLDFRESVVRMNLQIALEIYLVLGKWSLLDYGASRTDAP